MCVYVSECVRVVCVYVCMSVSHTLLSLCVSLSLIHVQGFCLVNVCVSQMASVRRCGCLCKHTIVEVDVDT